MCHVFAFGRQRIPPSLFFFNDTATTEIYTLSHTTLFRSPPNSTRVEGAPRMPLSNGLLEVVSRTGDRKSTRLNSSHQIISYAVFCLKKKNKNRTEHCRPARRRHALYTRPKYEYYPPPERT